MAKEFQIGRPAGDEASAFQFGYINQVVGEDVLATLASQLPALEACFGSYTEATSLFRYAPDKWTVRQSLNHITDTERIFTFRALWIARGLKPPLPSFEQETAAAGAEADTIAYADLREEFHRVRTATLSLFQNMPSAGWSRAGIAGDHRVTTRALAFMTAGHLEHHLKIMRERYSVSV